MSSLLFKTTNYILKKSEIKNISYSLSKLIIIIYSLDF